MSRFNVLFAKLGFVKRRRIHLHLSIMNILIFVLLLIETPRLMDDPLNLNEVKASISEIAELTRETQFVQLQSEMDNIMRFYDKEMENNPTHNKTNNKTREEDEE